MKIVLDAGHGGMDGGASVNDIVEADITLAITEKIARQLKRMGAEVILTHSIEGDVVTEHERDLEYASLRERKRQDIFYVKPLWSEKSQMYF